MRNLVLLFFLPLLAAAQDTIIRRAGGEGGGSVAAGSGISVATNGSVYTVSATGTASNAQPPSVQLTNVSNGALYANTNYVTNLLAGFGTNNFLLAQSRTNVVTNRFELDYLFTDQPLVAVFNGRMLTGTVDVSASTYVATNNIRGSYLTASRIAVIDAAKNITNADATLDTNLRQWGGVTTNQYSTLDQLNLYAQEQAFTNAAVAGGNLIVDMRTNAASYVECTPGAAFTLVLTNAPAAGRVKSVVLFLKGDGTDRTMTFQTKAGAATLTNRVGAAYTSTYVITNNQQFVMTITAKPNAANTTDMTNIVYAIAPNTP